jgi:large subunit ribosomal protein L10
MSKILKSLMQGEIKARFDGVDGGVFVSSAGLNSEKTYDLRKTLNAQGVKFTVVRNAFVTKVFPEFGYDAEKLGEVLKGPVAVVYTTEENSAAVSAKAIAAWKKDNKDKVITWKGAFLDGQVLGAKDAEQLKNAPTKDGARAMLLGVIQAPATQMLATIREPHARIVYLLNNWKDEREKSGAA